MTAPSSAATLRTPESRPAAGLCAPGQVERGGGLFGGEGSPVGKRDTAAELEAPGETVLADAVALTEHRLGREGPVQRKKPLPDEAPQGQIHFIGAEKGVEAALRHGQGELQRGRHLRRRRGGGRGGGQRLLHAAPAQPQQEGRCQYPDQTQMEGVFSLHGSPPGKSRIGKSEKRHIPFPFSLFFLISAARSQPPGFPGRRL